MIVGSTKKKKAPQQNTEFKEEIIPQQETTEQFLLQTIESRDYSAAATFIEFLRDELNVPYTKELALWLGYSYFHLGEYSKAIEIYEQLLKDDPDDSILHLYISSCQYYCQDYDEAQNSALRGPSCDFRTRLLFHIAHKRGDENQLLKAHSDLVGTLENQMSLAAIHYLRTHYQEAIEIYQRIIQQHPDFLALFVYIAMCQFKIDAFEESNDFVDQYLAVNSDSAVALNLKACDYLRTFGADTAESQLLQIKKFSSSSYSFVESLLQHNLVVFHNGLDGFTTLPKIVDHFPEARFNLILLYMRESNSAEAYNLIQDFTPLDPTELILRATVLLAYGELTNDTGLIEEASGIFLELGQLDVVRDTVPGRQCLATAKFITSEYQDTMRIFDSIEEFSSGCDEFYYNKGMTLALSQRWAEAQRYFLLVKNVHYTAEIFFNSWLCRCYIKNNKPDAAWNLYNEATQSEDAKTLLQIIANDCFLGGYYYYSMKAYDLLAKFEGDATMREGMIASAIGVFRGILSRRESSDKLYDVLTTLASEPEAESVLQTIQSYVEASGQLDAGGF